MIVVTRQLVRFGLVGTGAFAVDFAIYALLLNFFEMVHAKLLSFLAATVFTFVLNRSWTFGLRRMDQLRIPQFLLVYSVSLVVNSTINVVSYSMLGNEVVSFLTATAVSSVINFIGLRVLVFRSGKNAGSDYLGP